MTAPTIIQDLFANDVTRDIEEVIKVDQADEAIIKFEIDEYVVTKAIARYYEQNFECANRPDPCGPGRMQLQSGHKYSPKHKTVSANRRWEYPTLINVIIQRIEQD